MKTSGRSILGAALVSVSVAVAVATLLVGGAASNCALAAPGGPPPGGRIGGPIRGALEYAGATDEQKAKAKTLGEAARASVAGLAAQARADRQALQDLLAAPNPDPKAVGTAFLKVDADRKALKGAREKALAEVRALLSPDQRVKFDAFLEGAQRDRRAMAAGPLGPGRRAGQP